MKQKIKNPLTSKEGEILNTIGKVKMVTKSLSIFKKFCMPCRIKVTMDIRRFGKFKHYKNLCPACKKIALEEWGDNAE